MAPAEMADFSVNETVGGPTVRHRRLSAELRKLRESAELTPQQAADLLGWSRPKLVRIETSGGAPSADDVQRILDAYGGTDQALRLALVQLVQDVRVRGWWSAYGDVVGGSYAQCEDAATEIRSYQTSFIPGLLQTPAYARAIMQEDDPDLIERRVQARLTRQALLTRPSAPKLSIVLDETALRLPIGDGEVMREQLEALLTAARRSNIGIRVLESSAGLHPGRTGGSFVIFSFASPIEPDVVYLETIAGGLYLEEIAQGRRCSLLHEGIVSTALPEDPSAALIAAIIKE
ncbi:helix-turn-helix protein [Actinocorallia herbida]|uniref:Helix-turn-helix protein n=1 Tax=Actinocorallia herbida TaxID=58109 RepID=A0A3N1D926_9ACTN|nr:helix-turn-helix transcriptional regulator [Actinocorallia herbida]ROO90030.1 helix-turn-helix protein [Actinocorallia herbida]